MSIYTSPEAAIERNWEAGYPEADEAPVTEDEGTFAAHTLTGLVAAYELLQSRKARFELNQRLIRRGVGFPADQDHYEQTCIAATRQYNRLLTASVLDQVFADHYEAENLVKLEYRASRGDADALEALGR